MPRNPEYRRSSRKSATSRQANQPVRKRRSREGRPRPPLRPMQTLKLRAVKCCAMMSLGTPAISRRKYSIALFFVAAPQRCGWNRPQVAGVPERNHVEKLVCGSKLIAGALVVPDERALSVPRKREATNEPCLLLGVWRSNTGISTFKLLALVP